MIKNCKIFEFKNYNFGRYSEKKTWNIKILKIFLKDFFFKSYLQHERAPRRIAWGIRLIVYPKSKFNEFELGHWTTILSIQILIYGVVVYVAELQMSIWIDGSSSAI